MHPKLSQTDFLGHLECLLMAQMNDLCQKPQRVFLYGFHCMDALADLYANEVYTQNTSVHLAGAMDRWPTSSVDVCVVACANAMARKEPMWLDRVGAVLKPGGVIIFHAWEAGSNMQWPGLCKPKWAAEDMVNALSAGQWSNPQVMLHQVDWEIGSKDAATRELANAGYTQHDLISIEKLCWPQSWSCNIMCGYAQRKQLSVVDLSSINVRSE